MLIVLQKEILLYLAEHSYFGHSRGVTRILKATGGAVRGSTFEKTLLLALRGSVVIEAPFDDDVSLSPQEWEALIMDEAHGIYSLYLIAAVLISSLFQASNVPGTTSDTLSSFYSLEILRLSAEMEQYKPMGAMTLVLSLPVAWFGATDGPATPKLDFGRVDRVSERHVSADGSHGSRKSIICKEASYDISMKNTATRQSQRTSLTCNYSDDNRLGKR